MTQNTIFFDNKSPPGDLGVKIKKGLIIYSPFYYKVLKIMVFYPTKV